MEKLKVIGTEDGELVVATDAGERFTLVVDDVLRAELRRARRERDAPTRTARVSPKEIQAQIRAGLSTREVAELLGVSVDDVMRFEAPVLAEREFVVGQALSVPVLLGSALDETTTSFGEAVRAKLADAQATGERWTSWKEDGGWIVKLTFLAGEVERDARWGFDPRRSSLSPLNADATQLSRQGALPEGLIPRLRALDHPGIKDDTRFDSGAFGPRREAPAESAPAGATAATATAAEAAIKRAPEPAATTSAETADLLDALRRRRGQRVGAPTGDSSPAAAPAPAPVALFDALDGETSDDDEAGQASKVLPLADAVSDQPRRKGRAALPSWDEIVFGARSDES